MIFCQDLLEWAKTYEGLPYHALLSDAPYALLPTSSRRGSPRVPGTGPFARHTLSTKGFMGKEWDNEIAFYPETWDAVGAHLLPGAFLAVFGGSRTYHRLASAIEDAGFVLNSAISWTFGSGFPKAARIRTGEELETGEMEDLTDIRSGSLHAGRDTGKVYTRPVLEAHGMQKVWEGHRYGLQALKPAAEFICIAQKRYDRSPRTCIVETGAGALNIDAGRVEASEPVKREGAGGLLSHVRDDKTYVRDRYDHNAEVIDDLGRWPANFILTHSPFCRKLGTKVVSGNGHAPESRPKSERVAGPEGLTEQTGLPERKFTGEIVDDWECVEGCPVLALDRQSGQVGANAPVQGHEPSNVTGDTGIYNEMMRAGAGTFYADEGTASRFFFQTDWEFEHADPFFYAAKASRGERDDGLRGIFQCLSAGKPNVIHEADPLFSEKHFHVDANGNPIRHTKGKRAGQIAYRDCRRNGHPTVKPISLSRYLASLLLPPGSYTPRRLMVPFSGSGSEMCGAVLAGWEEIDGIDSDPEHVAVAEKRFDYWRRQVQRKLFE